MNNLFRGPASFRWRFLLVVFATAVVPLALIGFWVTQSVVTAGESLLRSELDSSLTQIGTAVQQRWSFRQGQLVLMAQNDAALRAVASDPANPPTPADSAYLARLFAGSSEMFPSVEYRKGNGAVPWSMSGVQKDAADDRGMVATVAAPPAITVTLPMESPDRTGTKGELVARVRLEYVLPPDTALRLPNGAVLQVIDRTTRRSLLSVPLGDSLLARDRFVVRDAEWLSSRRTLANPPLDVVIAAPTRRYVQPFERAARRGAAAVGVIALLALVVSAWLTGRLTASLESLADAADAVARGELAHHIKATGSDEVGRVAAAFNSMTENLRRTLGELSQRQALAAVGEYASSLSHEIRNALTAVRVDLQRAEETMPADLAARPLVARSLKHLTNLEATVSRSLRLARSGQTPRRPVDLRKVLGSAAQSASGTFAENGGVLEPFIGGTEPVWVRGDAPSLEQLFLNLLLNSAHALERGGCTKLTLEIEGANACVSVTDDGEGIEPEDLTRVLDPFFSTKSDGTGLGLPIARQIATAHGGSLRIDSTPGEGTRVVVRLPLAS